MTDEEINALAEGDELDRAIELHVFGQKLERGWAPMAYSTNWQWAGELVEKFKMTITPKIDATERSRWLADVRLVPHGDLWLAFGPTAPIAICRAALKSVRQQEPV